MIKLCITFQLLTQTALRKKFIISNKTMDILEIFKTILTVHNGIYFIF